MGRVTGLRAALVAFSVLVACTSSASDSEFHPSFHTAPCPQDLESFLIPTHTCGYLTVLEDRSRPTDRTIRLFVVRIEPQAGKPADGAAMFVPGTDLAVGNDFYGIANLAQRVDREVFLMDQRGAGRSRPSLDCPEVDSLSADALRSGIEQTHTHDAFLAAVTACRARLSAAGVDVTAYDLTEMAQDGVDLRRALGIDTWGISTYGTASLVALEMLREDPAHVDLMVLDSPEFPQLDPLQTDVSGTRSGLAAIFDDCGKHPRCEAAYPELERTLRLATGRLDDHPLTVSTKTASGMRFDVRVDGSALLRALRMLLRSQTDTLQASEPAAIYEAARGDVSSIIAPMLAFAPAFCAGYLPSCDAAHVVSEGTYLSVMCPLFAYWDGPETATSLAASHPNADTLGTNPWFAACARWKVASVDPSVIQPVNSNVPTLILLGRYDPYAPADVVRRAAETLTRRWVVVNPSGGHNALSQSCMIQVRNGWVVHATSPPDLGCVSSIPPKPFVIDRP